jgi:bacterial/archaeal transporter family-2 protein
VTAQLYFAALIVGALTPVQVGINASLKASLDNSLAAGLANFIVGGLSILLVALLIRPGIPALTAVASVPVWGWLGGLIGATFVVATLSLGPKLGAATLFVLVIAGQMLASMALDHFGVIGFPLRAITVPRIAGAVLLVAGVVLIVRN